MADQKSLETLQKVIEEGDRWLLDNGIVSDLTHNALVTGVYASYPDVRFMDYDMNKEEKWIDMRLYVSFWKLLWLTITGKRGKLLDDCFFNVSDYLKNFSVRVTIKRYKGQDQKA